jgi:hypothetical protein
MAAKGLNPTNPNLQIEGNCAVLSLDTELPHLNEYPVLQFSNI